MTATNKTRAPETGCCEDYCKEQADNNEHTCKHYKRAGHR